MYDRRHRIAFTLAAAVVATVLAVAPAPAARADHQLRFEAERVVRLAHELDGSAYDAYRLSDRRAPYYRGVNAAFARFSDAAADFHRAVENGRYDSYRAERAFDLLADRYYELRGEFRAFHGPLAVREAFHRINAPMERLYWTYTGRDLYRDDPNVRRARGWGHGGVRDRAGARYDVRYGERRDGRYEDGRYDGGRYDGGRYEDDGRGGAGRTRPGRH